MLPEPFIEAKEIIRTLQNNGYKAYFVGGAVRDYLLHKEVNDVDITTSATPDQVINIFPTTIPVGIEHGTVIVRQNQQSYEVTTFRSEDEYRDFRRPSSVNFIESLEEDLSRRDFTVNAIAMSEDGNTIDPFSEINDLNDSLIRTVGNPKQRFSEDPLRIMRAVRFVSQLSFTLAEEVQTAIKEQGPLLQNISIERIAVEFEKLLRGQSVEKALFLILETELYNYLPGFENKRATFERLTELEITKLTQNREYWALLLNLMGEGNAEPLLQTWKRPSKLIKEVNGILSIQDEINQLTLYQAGFDISLSAAKVNAVKSKQNVGEEKKKVINNYNTMPIHTRKDLAMTAAEVIELGNKKPGPWVGDCFEKMAKVIIEKKIKNRKDDLIQWLREELFK